MLINVRLRMDIVCHGFTFIHNFDSGNLGKVEFIGENEEKNEEKMYEFNIWTRPDCAGTEYVNGNRTWFHFGVADIPQPCFIKLNVVMNKQGKMYGQGMAPVFRTLPTHPAWDRIKERPTFMSLGGNFFLSFRHQVSEIGNAVTYFAFTYPFSYSDLESYLGFLDMREFDSNNTTIFREPLEIEKTAFKSDDIYYHREILCKSIEGRNIHLITITAMNDIFQHREERLTNLFPDDSNPRPYYFNKKVVFLSARVHPGETPSSFILNGMLNYLLVDKEPTANLLRKHFVFKIIPMLNPDGVFHGNYRTDIRGTNLNRVYSNPSLTEHPSIYGAKALAVYYNNKRNRCEKLNAYPIGDSTKITRIEDGVSDLTIDKQDIREKKKEDYELGNEKPKLFNCTEGGAPPNVKLLEPRLFLYIDMHGHASKKGIFMYGNHFKELVNNIECRLFPKLVSINSPHFHFESCNFTEKNMYAKDKRDGSSKEGSGRVAVYKATGLIRCYTLECNYNTGKIVNALPPLPAAEKKQIPPLPTISPPKYTPLIYEETGRHILLAVLDLAGHNPFSRVPQSQYRTLNSLREALRVKVVGESNLQLLKDKRITSNQKVCRGETRAWKRPKGPGAVTVGCNNVPTSSATVMSAQKKLQTTAKRSKLSTEPQSRLEKKSSGDARRLIPEQRRKKLKPK